MGMRIRRGIVTGLTMLVVQYVYISLNAEKIVMAMSDCR